MGTYLTKSNPGQDSQKLIPSAKRFFNSTFEILGDQLPLKTYNGDACLLNSFIKTKQNTPVC
jgi:hypothetical protein